MNLNFKFNIFKRTFLFQFGIFKQATEWTVGTMNRTADNNYIIYMDYDLMREEYVKDEVVHLQEVFGLGDFHIFRSSEKGFHAVCFDKVTAKEFIEILENSSCDPMFKNVPRYKSIRNWVLRCFPKGSKDKPQFLYTLKSKHLNNRSTSNAHYKLIKSIYPDLKINQPTNSDGLNELYTIQYPTGSNI